MVNMRAEPWVLLACGLSFGACGGPEPASIRAPEQLEIDGTDPFRIDATAVDDAGLEMQEVSVVIANVRDPAVLSLEPNGVLNCQKWGRTGVVLQASSVEREVVVSCQVVSEVRGAPQKLVAVLDADDEGRPQPKALGGYAFQALDSDGKAIVDGEVALSVDDGGVLSVGKDGLARALKPGLGVLTGSLGGQSAQLEVSVGLLVTLRKSVLVEAGERIEVPVDAGRYRVAVGADLPMGVDAVAGTCEPHESATAVDVTCTLAKAGVVRVANRGVRGRGDDAHATIRVVRVP